MWESIRMLDEMAYRTAGQGGFSPTEIARACDVSVSTVNRRISELLKWRRVNWKRRGTYELNTDDRMMGALVDVYKAVAE